MGRGAGQEITSVSPTRKQARRQQQRQRVYKQLQQVFPDHALASDLDTEQLRIADPDKREQNQFVRAADGKRIWAHTRLYRYCPNMSNHDNLWIATSLRLDHLTGKIFAINEVQKYIPGGLSGQGRAFSYKIEDCGTDLDRAVETAQGMYDQAWQQLKASEHGKHAKRTAVRFETLPAGSSEVLEYKDQAFTADREVIEKQLLEGARHRQRYQTHVGQAREAAEQLQSTAEALGYELEIDTLIPKAA